MEDENVAQNIKLFEEQYLLERASREDPISLRKIKTSRLTSRVIIRNVKYMVDNLFALCDEHGEISIYDTSTYELKEFQNKYLSKRVPSYSIQFYSNYYTHPKTKQTVDVLCQCFLNNMIILWNITNYIKTKELIPYKIIYASNDNIYDCVILSNYNMIAAAHQNLRMLAFYSLSNKPQMFIQRKLTKMLFAQQFEHQVFSLQYDRKRNLIYTALINSEVHFYDIHQRQVTHIIKSSENDHYSFHTMLVPRHIYHSDISEDRVNTKMTNEEYDFEYYIQCNDKGIICINLDEKCISSVIGGHINQTRSFSYHKESNSILSISVDRKIGIHPLQIVKRNQFQMESHPLSVFKEANLKGLCNSIALHKVDVLAVSWIGEIGQYQYVINR